MKKNRRKLKLLICGLLACASVFAFSGCAKTVGKFFYKFTTESAELGQQMGKETAEALIENEHSKGWIESLDNFVYGLLVKVLG